MTIDRERRLRELSWSRHPSESEPSGDEAERLSDMALYRYDQWRSRRNNPLSRDEAYAAALALTCNEDERRARVFTHQTGATSNGRMI